MKRFSVVFLMLLIAAAALVAEGARESGGAVFDDETVSLTGTIDLSSNPPILETGGKEYLVMVPRLYQAEAEVSDGDTVTLEGYVHDGVGRLTTGQQVIRVSKAVVNGEEYEIEAYRGSGNAAGPQGGRSGGRRSFDNSANSGPGRASGKPGMPGRR